MREILFRGECVETGDWIKGFYVRLHDSRGHESHRIYSGYAETDCGDYYPDWWEVDPATVGQFTGLTDKNGKRIFEGDILLVKTTLDSVKKETRNDEYITKGVVVFNEGHFELEGKGLVLCTYWGCKSLFVAARFKEHEVIGNIHDNPEVLHE